MLAGYRRLVVKVGSALLVRDDGLDRGWLDSLCDDIAGLTARGRDVVVVSSGAIALGAAVVGIRRDRARLEDLQAAAAAGQVQLVHAYQASLRRHDGAVAQVLLTPDDTENRRRFLNARGTLAKLLECGVVPIVNENDTVATEEIRYGDNDRLAARVAQLVMADALVLLSDVDGLYRTDPREDPAACHIAQVPRIDEDIVAMAGETRSAVGTGGMATKIAAARIATQAGCDTLVSSGLMHNPLSALAGGGRATRFPAASTPAAARKQWLAGALQVSGSVRIDAGARAALADGGSLLPVGIVAVDGDFQRGDVVRILAEDGEDLGRGLSEYSSDEATRIRGCRSDAIPERLGYHGRAALIHRDELVLFDTDD